MNDNFLHVGELTEASLLEVFESAAASGQRIALNPTRWILPMAERRYTLLEITGAMGAALASMRMRGALDAATPRELDLFMDELVGRLKALAAVDPVSTTGAGATVISPND